ncbi:MAG: type II secretion system minor pseudopilin GspJ [Aquisalimonadaceae bacterium]
MRARGFTLIELLVAMSIFAVVSVMAYGGLRLLVDNRDQVTASADRLGEIQRAFSIIERDMQQALARGVRDPFGDPRQAMLSDDLAALEFTRAGRANPLGRTRSELQRVGYRLEEGTLLRMGWEVLDQVPEPALSEQPLLEGVEEITVRFFPPEGEWVEVWPPASAGPGSPLLPLAVEITLTLEDMGALPRLFRLPDPPMEQQQ